MSLARFQAWVAPVSVAVVIAAEMAVLNHWAFAHLALHDGGIVVYGADRLLAGQVPYRDFSHIFSPGAIVVLAGLYLVFGTQVSTTLLTAVLLAVGMALLVLLQARSTGLPRGWAVFAAWLAVNAGIVWWPTPSYHWFATLAALAGTVAAMRAAESGSARWMMAAGLLLAATCWFLQTRGALVCLLVGAGLLALRPTAIRLVSAGAALAAAPLPVLLTSVPFASVWQAVVVFPLSHYPINRQPFMGLDLFPSAPMVDHWRKILQVMLEVGWLWLALAALLATGLGAIHSRNRVLGLAALGGAAGVLSILNLPLAGHFTFVAPLLVVPFLWAARQLAHGRPAAQALLAVAGALHVLTFAPLHEGWLVITGQTTSIASPRGPVPIGTATELAATPGTLKPVLDYIAENATLGEPVFAYPAISTYYFLLDRPNPTAHDWLWPGVQPYEQFLAVARDLERDPPRFAIRDHSIGDFDLPPGPSPARDSLVLMNQIFERLYRPVLRAGYLEVLQRR